MIEHITWYDHASFRLDGEQVVYIDPWEIPPGPKADIILVSHDHYDHLSVPDIGRIAGPDTVIVTTREAAHKLKSWQVRVLKPGEQLEVQGVPIEGVAAYNPAKKFHPRSNQWLGFVVTLRGQRIYYVGDSDATPEMLAVRADLVLIPVGGTYTMDAAEAAAAINSMKPGLAVPYHWGKIVGDASDAKRFAALCQVPVKILQQVVRKK